MCASAGSISIGLPVTLAVGGAAVSVGTGVRIGLPVTVTVGTPAVAVGSGVRVGLAGPVAVGSDVEVTVRVVVATGVADAVGATVTVGVHGTHWSVSWSQVASRSSQGLPAPLHSDWPQTSSPVQ
jgi:hypothetical protein